VVLLCRRRDNRISGSTKTRGAAELVDQKGVGTRQGKGDVSGSTTKGKVRV